MSSLNIYPEAFGATPPSLTTTLFPKAHRQRRHSIIAGGLKVVVNCFGWNLPTH
jgi:hypothetical protein